MGSRRVCSFRAGTPTAMFTPASVFRPGRLRDVMTPADWRVFQQVAERTRATFADLDQDEGAPSVSSTPTSSWATATSSRTRAAGGCHRLRRLRLGYLLYDLCPRWTTSPTRAPTRRCVGRSSTATSASATCRRRGRRICHGQPQEAVREPARRAVSGVDPRRRSPPLYVWRHHFGPATYLGRTSATTRRHVRASGANRADPIDTETAGRPSGLGPVSMGV